MAIVKYSINGDSLPISIQMTSGNYLIPAKSIMDPTGERCIIYDCYIVSLNQVQQNGTDIEYYVDKVRQIANLYEQGVSKNDILQKMAKNHIDKHSRIIDTDLMMIVSALRRIIEVIEGNCDGKELILSALQIVLNNYINKTFVTVYKQTPYGPQVSLVPMESYIKSN